MAAWQHISPGALAELVRKAGSSVQTGVLVVDVRDEQEFQGGHIKGAVNAPSSSFDDGAAKQIQEQIAATKASKVVVHCYKCVQRGPACATQLSEYLDKSDTNGTKPEVLVLEGGIRSFLEEFKGDTSVLTPCASADASVAAAGH